MRNTLSKSVNIKTAVWVSLKAVAVCIILSTVGTWGLVAWMRPQLQLHYSPQAMYMLSLLWNSQVFLFEAFATGAVALVAFRIVVSWGFARK